MGTYTPEKLSALFEACRSARGATAKGAALEDFTEHVFLHVPSVRLYARNAIDESGAQEIDIVFTHFYPVSMLPIIDLQIFIECKNETRRTSAQEVEIFATKLRSRNAATGILVTMSGLSGRPGRQGHAQIRDELADGVSIVVVKAEELLNLASPSDLGILLAERLAELRTNRGYRTI